MNGESSSPFGVIGITGDSQQPTPRKPRNLAEKVSGAIDVPFQYVGEHVTGPILGGIGEAVGSFFPAHQQGIKETATEFGRQVPRMMAEAALTHRPGISRAVGLADVGLKSYAESPPEKPEAQRLASAGIQTAAWHLAPKVGGRVSGSMVKPIDPGAIEPLLRTAARRGASTIGTLGAFEAANVASQAVQGESYNPFTPEHLGGVAAAVAPFEAMGLFADLRAQREATKTLNTRQENEHKLGDQPPQAPLGALQAPSRAFDKPVGVGEGVEQITHSAFRPDPTKPLAEYGANHPEILTRLGVKGFESRESRNTPQFGYRTNLRDFITREEAYDLATRTGQKFEGVELGREGKQIHSDEIKASGGVKGVLSMERSQESKEHRLMQWLTAFGKVHGPMALDRLKEAIDPVALKLTAPAMPYFHSIAKEATTVVRAGKNIVFKFPEAKLAKAAYDDAVDSFGPGEIRLKGTDLVIPVKGMLEADGYDVEPFKLSDVADTFSDPLERAKFLAHAEPGDRQMEYQKAEGFYPQDYLKMFDTLSKIRPEPVVGGPKIMTMEQGQRSADKRITVELTDLDSYGYPPSRISIAGENIARLMRNPGESLTDYYIRDLFEHSKADLRKSTDPNELLKGVYGFFQWKFGTLLGLPKDQVDAISRLAVNLTARVGHSQGETRIFANMPERQADGSYAIRSYFADPTKKTGPLIGLEVDVGSGVSSELFHSFQGLFHEIFHGFHRRFQLGEKLPDPVMDEALGKLVHDIFELKLSPVEKAQGIAAVLKSMRGAETETNRTFVQRRQAHYTDTPAGNAEFLADLFGLVAMGGTLKESHSAWRNTEALIKFGNADFRTVASNLMRDVSYAIKSAAEFVKKVLGWKPSSISKLEEIVSNMQKLRKSVEFGDKATEAFLQLMESRQATPWSPIPRIDHARVERLFQAINSEGYDLPEVRSMVREASRFVIPQELPDRKVKKGEKPELPYHLNFMHHMIPMLQMHHWFPEAADGVRIAKNMMGYVKQAIQVMHDQFRNKDTGRYDSVAVEKERAPGPINSAINALAMKQQELVEERAGQELKPDEKMAVPAYAKLSKEEREFVDDMMARHQSAHMKGAYAYVQALKESVMVNRWTAVWQEKDLGIAWDKARDLTKALVTLYADSDLLGQGPQDNPKLHEEVGKANQLLAEYAKTRPDVLELMKAKFTTDENGQPLGVGAVPDFIQGYRNVREKLLGKWVPLAKDDPNYPGFGFEGKPGYWPEGRLGQFVLAWGERVTGPGGAVTVVPHLVGIKSRMEWNKQHQALLERQAKESGLPEEKRTLAYLKAIDKENERDKFAGMRPDLFNVYNEAINKLNNRVLASLSRDHPGNKELIDELRSELQPAGEMARLMEMPAMRERRLVAGRETLNYPEVSIHYMANLAYTIAKKEVRAQMDAFLRDPKMRAQPELQAKFRRYFNELMSPTEHGFTPFKALIAFNYIMLSPSLAVIEWTQQLTNHIPALINAGMGIGDAFKNVYKGNVDFLNAVKEGLKYKKGFNVYDGVDGEITQAVRKAVELGVIDAGWVQEYMHLGDDIPFLNMSNTFGGEGTVLDRTGLLGKPLYMLYQVGMRWHNLAIHLNTEMGFKTAYEHFRKQGSDPEKAFHQASQLVGESMHGGGRASRPLWFLGIGPANPGATVGGLMYILQMYMYNTIAQQAAYLRSAIKNTVKNPTELSAAHKAAGAMLGAQLMFAGMMGLPFSSQIIALIEQLFPTSEPKKKMREMFFGTGEWLNSKVHLAGQDRELGNFLADAGTDGLLNSIPGGINIANRFELGGLLGVSPYGGFDWKNVLGPGPAMLSKLAQGAVALPEKIGEGDYTGAAMGLVPNTNIQRLYKLAADGWNIRNKDERLNLELSKSEATLQALGFTPKRVAENRQLLEMKRRADTIHSKEAKAFHERMASLVIAGKLGEVTEELHNRARTEALYDPREGARRIAELVQQKTVPFDPTRTGARGGATYKVGRLFPESVEERRESGPSEIQLLGQRLGLTRAVGFPARPTSTEFRVAQQVDRLMQMYPMMTRGEAKALLEYQLNPRRSAMWGGRSPLESYLGSFGQ